MQAACFFVYGKEPREPGLPRRLDKSFPDAQIFLAGWAAISHIRPAMKQLTALLTIFAMFASPALAWTGGPYGNNTYDGFDGGIFQYTIRGNNVSGLARFTQNTASSYNSEFGDSVTYYNGITYYGESYGFVDFVGSIADGVINATAAGTDLNNPAAVLRSTNGTSWGVFNGVRYGTGNPLFGPYSPGGPESTQMVANGTWTGKLTRKYPVPRFTGTGEMTFFGEGESNEGLSVDQTRVSTGDFLPPRLDAGLPAANGTFRDFITVPTDSFKNKSVVPITVYGGRISTQPYLGSNAFRAL